jgi:hypothetical protein
MLALLLLLVVLVVIGIYVYMTTTESTLFETSTGTSTGTLTRAKSSLLQSAASVGLKPTSVQDIVKKVKNEPNPSCVFMSPLLGYNPPRCPTFYVYNSTTKCCDLEPDRKPSKIEQNLKLAQTMSRDIAITVIADSLIRKLLPLIIEKLAKNVLAKIIEIIIERIVAAVATRITIMISVNAALIAVSGPIGAMMSAAMDLVMIIALTVDILDPQGYNLYTANSINVTMRNAIEYAIQKSCGENGIEYPMLFMIRLVYPDGYNMAYRACINEYIPQSFDILKKNPDTVDIFMAVITSLQSDPTYNMTKDQSDMFAAALQTAMDSEPKKRDEFMYTELRKYIPDNEKRYVKLYPELSTAKTIGISLTEEGCTWWNESKKAEWFYYTDIMGHSAKPPDDYTPPLAAIFTDRYGTLDVNNPKSGDQYNMIQNTLPFKRPLALPAAILFAACERPRRAQVTGTGLTAAITGAGALGGASVDPTQYGVSFNPESRVCKYTNRYCDRMGMEYNPRGANGEGDCKLQPGQHIAELIFSTYVVRSVTHPVEFVKTMNPGNDAEKYLGLAGTLFPPLGAGLQLYNLTQKAGGLAFEGVTGGYKINKTTCKDPTDLIRVFQNKDNRCINLQVTDYNNNLYDGQSANDACRGAMFRVCVPRGGQVNVKGTTYLCGAKLRTGSIHYDLLKQPPLLDANAVIRVAHTQCDDYGSVYPVFKGIYEETKCNGDDCKFNKSTYNKYVGIT